MPARIPLIAALGLLCCGACTLMAADKVVPVEGEPFPAELLGVTPSWTVKFSTDDGSRELAADRLVKWGSFAEPAHGTHAVLADGGILVTQDARLQGEKLQGTSATNGEWELPIELVAAIIFRPPLDRKARDELLYRAWHAEGRNDRLLLDNGDEILGTITALDTTKVVLRAAAGPLEVKVDTLAAAMFDPSLTARPRHDGLAAIVGLADGSRLRAVEMATSGEATRLKLVGGAELSVPTAAVVGLQVTGGSATYLSDLEPASYRHIPYLTLTWPYRTDRGVTGTMLRADGRLYLKGLGMHSPARITYNLDGEYRRFESEVAVDDQAQGGGSVAFRVFVDDGSGAWQERGASGILRGGQPPTSISVDLSGAKRISLLVDFADRGDELDHADWLDARLVK